MREVRFLSIMAKAFFGPFKFDVTVHRSNCCTKLVPQIQVWTLSECASKGLKTNQDPELFGGAFGDICCMKGAAQVRGDGDA